MRNLVCHKVSEGLAGGLEAAAGRLGLRWLPVDGVDEAVSQAASPDTALVAFGTPADQSGLKELTTAFDLRYVASVMIAADGRWETAAYQAGIGEYIVMPMDQQLLDARLGSIIATRDTLRQARDQMWMAFAYRNAALAESLYVYEIDPVTSKATVLRMSDQAANEYFPLDCYCSGAGSQGYYHPDDWPLIVSTFAPDSLAKEMASGRDDITLSYRIRSRAGRFDWVETKLHFVKDAYGRPSAFSYVKLVDEQRRQQAVLERILHEEIEEIISIDVDDDVFHCIYEAEGAKPGPGCYSLLYADNLKKYATGADVAALVDQLSLAGLQEALVRRPDVSFSYWMQQYDGQRHNNKLTAFYADERHKQIILVTRDVTDLAMEAQKRQQQLEIALTAAQQASAAKTNFLSRMSHEIRTPMNAIIGMNTLAVQALGNDEKVAECLSKIGISAHYLLSLINDILDMSRIESGKMLLRNEQFDFSEFIAGINTMIYNQARIKGLEYECHIAANVAESYIGDAIKLQQTLINVLGNAVKFTAHGCVTMSVEQVSRVGNQDKVRFRVNDTGIGISEADLDKIFEPFEQGDNTTTAVFGGTGLGLAITKSLVDIMGGTIHVRSIVGVGSEFDIELPLTVDEMVVSHAPLAYHFESLHTLIVDDDVITCEQTTEILREIGMQGEWVSSGAEAVERVRKDLEKSRYFDFVLID